MHANYRSPVWFTAHHFVRVDGENYFQMPDGLSFDEATTYGVPFQTAAAALGLYHTLKLPESSAVGKEATPILVWGGACMCYLQYSRITL